MDDGDAYEYDAGGDGVYRQTGVVYGGDGIVYYQNNNNEEEEEEEASGHEVKKRGCDSFVIGFEERRRGRR